ncbi:MAG: SNF2-related protein [Chloroflexota bacterium]
MTLLEEIQSKEHLSSVNAQVASRGRKYFRDGKVELVHLEDRHAHLHVEGSYDNEYCVDIELDSDGDLKFYCDCPAYEDWDLCKHIVASVLHLRELAKNEDRLNSGRPKLGKELSRVDDMRWRYRLDSTMNQIVYGSSGTSSRRTQPYLLFFSLYKTYYQRRVYALKARASQLPEYLYDPAEKKRIGTDEDFQKFVMSGALNGSNMTVVSANTQLDPQMCLNVPKSLIAMVNVIKSAGYYYGETELTGDIASLLDLGAEIYTGSQQQPLRKQLNVLSGKSEAALSLGYEDDVLVVSPEIRVDEEKIQLSETNVEVLDQKESILRVGDSIVVLGEVNTGVFSMAEGNQELRFNPAEADFFLNTYLPPLLDSVPLVGDAIHWTDVHGLTPTKQLYIFEDKKSNKKDSLLVSLSFKYGDHVVPYIETWSDHRILRDETRPNELAFVKVYVDADYELDVKSNVSGTRSGLKKAPNPHSDPALFSLRANIDPIDFLLRKIPTLVADGFEIFGEDTLKSIKVNRHKPTLSLNVSSGIDWFDVQALVQFGDMSVSLPEIRKAVRKKEQFVKLADGSIGEIPAEWLDKYKHLFNLGQQNEDGIRFDSHHLTLIDQLLEEADQVSLDDKYTERLQKLKSFEGIKEVPLPAGFKGELRPYQKAGYDWLHFLQEFQFGGCLADDMGLGKTVQMLAFLASIHENEVDAAPSLIVMPRSLLFNWEREAERFTPTLKTLIHFGNDRQKNTDHFGEYDLIFTTYGIMRRDIEMLKAYQFYAIVLDESQAIKSPVTQVSKASRLLKGAHKLTMSGTPVENSTFELWSQFAFLNPGLLGGIDYFKREFGNPIEKKQDEDAAKFLKGMVYPFILRRTKQQVAPDLPPRTDEIVYTKMEPAQRKFYNKTRDEYRAQLLGLVAEQGVNGARMKVLEGLLRLRQICNHPKLVKSTFKGESAKMELLMERLENLAQPDEEGRPHKALIFSQFVQMLKLVEAELKKRKLPYVYLDGQTRKRQERIDAFQNDPDIPFFLISLKAGGVGLNLTAADYVIHVDPWWNPAVEMQATDRTHRIGQDRPVFVYKLITENSVEEKILELQQRKQKLVDQLISTESSFFKNLNADDIQVLFS